MGILCFPVGGRLPYPAGRSGEYHVGDGSYGRESAHPLFQTDTMGQSTGTAEEQAPLHKDRQAQYVFWAGGVCQVRGKAGLLHDQPFRGTARLICVLQLQVQHRDLFIHFIWTAVLEHLQRTVQYVQEYESKLVRSIGEKSAVDCRKKVSAKHWGFRRLSGE